ncbi:hypothetical protein ACTFIR_005052 [Dictyostelium discoideum]
MCHGGHLVYNPLMIVCYQEKHYYSSLINAEYDDHDENIDIDSTNYRELQIIAKSFKDIEPGNYDHYISKAVFSRNDIGDHCHFIYKKEILDLYFQNYRDQCSLFKDQNRNCKCIPPDLIEHYEYLKATVRLSVYSLDINGCLYYRFILYTYIKVNRENSVINFLSNAQLRQPLDLEVFKYIFSSYTGRMLNLIKFLFNNISKESIETKLKVINLKTDNTLTTTTNILSPKKSEDFGCLTIGKTESFNFTISIRILLICFYNLDRVDYIIYLFDKLPNVLFNPNYFSIFTIDYCLYSSSSSYYLELFINYFIENLNDNTINYLYHCLCITSKKGYTQIFKNIILSLQNIVVDVFCTPFVFEFGDCFGPFCVSGIYRVIVFY